jgi:hypothetical protein
MERYGIDNVRGGAFARIKLDEKEKIYLNIEIEKIRNGDRPR